MATKVYRYEYSGPEPDQLAGMVTGTVTPGDITGTSIQRDWTFDDATTSGDDLTGALQNWGWKFVADMTP